MGFAHVVLVDPGVAHIDPAYTYRVPDGMPVEVGSVVRTPVRGRSHRGVVIAVFDEADVPRTQPIRAILGPSLGTAAVELCAQVSFHWLSSLGEALAHAIPPRVAEEETRRPQIALSALPVPDFSWTGRYRGARNIIRAIERGGYDGFAWRPLANEHRGEAIASLALQALRRDKDVVVLLPDVRARSSVADALGRTLGDHAAWLGSNRSARERYRDWLRLHAGAAGVAIGGRSAVFAPVRDLGLVVVDDEAHISYKERRTPRFHARAVAAMRARAAGATLVVVGSPPSAEVHHAAERGVLTMVGPSRALEVRTRPPVHAVDLAKSDDGLVPGARTLAALRSTLENGQRAVLLVHRTGEGMRKIAKRAYRILEPKVAVRLDARSPAKDPDAFARACRDADLLIATPVLAKDIDLQGIGCVAVVETDAALAAPEFRAAEEAFATWWHAGRWLGPDGILVIETAQPRHPAVAALVRWDPSALWRAEAARRFELGYPPFAALVRVETAADEAESVVAEIGAVSSGAEILGPVEQEGRAIVVIRSADRTGLLERLRPLAARWRSESSDVRIDVDPREVLP